MTRRNYKAECFAILAHIKTQKEFNASGWIFDEYKPDRTCYVKTIDSLSEHMWEPLGDRYRTWKELADYLRAYTCGFWHGVKAGLQAGNNKRVCIEIKTPANRSGNRKRLYLLFDADGYRSDVLEERPNAFVLSDTFEVTPAEFREYARIANVQKGEK